MISSPGSTIGEMPSGRRTQVGIGGFNRRDDHPAIDMSVTERMSDAGRERFDAVFYRLLAKISWIA